MLRSERGLDGRTHRAPAPGGNNLRDRPREHPFGTVGERCGTYVIGYAADPSIIERMLRDIFIGDPPGNHDRILDFSTATTGGLVFIPTVDFLDGH